jgi:hypothetical protein
MKFYQPRLACDVAIAMCAELPPDQRESAAAFARQAMLNYAHAWERQERRLRPVRKEESTGQPNEALPQR